MALAHYPPSDRQLASIGSYPSSSYPDPSPMYSLSQFMGSSQVDQPYVSSVSSYLSESRSQWQPGLSTAYPSLSMSGVSPYSSPSSSQLSYPPEYPESAQRSALSDALRPSSSSRSYTSALGPPSPRDTPTLQRASWSSALYVVDSAEPEPALAPSPVPEPLSPASQVKEEDFEGSFIFELAASDALHGGLESMPEVPLRATHAPKAMRKMMGSFRLDPFAMHNGIRSAAVAAAPVGIEVGPLREEPVMFEFQVHLDYPLVPPSPRWSPARSASPLLYPLEDEPEEKWVASMGSYSPFEAGAVPGAGFAPLMTPAQSLNWSMSYQQEASDALSASPASSSGYPVQPLSST
ncbi:uncharacterized protein LAESUDRAFT_387276 [Laetiporus sulphureus 93-53]|uniref:Uncharacterized protein n=1 Tax=Laetiporus sulphureus 93-53 TaxID=1314785 RepID=A0A165CKI1_9APHY|nr:uncharacterized protein LAESUDRAFT_387276 [Laetiporus sulphureus 93-53]KZT02978.1 hypothetical protein LAESUDRAFT_387276 [Laetiporus sulphureus 93-53]